MDGTIALQLLAVVALVGLNGFFVATEFALVSIRRSRVETLAAEGNKPASRVLQTLDNLDEYIAATQLGITIASIGLGWIGEPALASLLDPLFERVLSEDLAFITAHGVAFVFAFAIITMLHVVFGELAPKSVALQYPERTSMVVARPATLFLYAMRPAILFLNGMGRAVLRFVGIREQELHQQLYTADEIELIVSASRESGELEDVEEHIIRRALVFADQSAAEVMVPRTEVISISESASISEVKELIREHPFSRFPVFRNNVDEIVGVLHVRDALPHLMDASPIRQIDLRQFVRPAYIFPSSLQIDKLLIEMKFEGIHFAVVVDEFGGVDGIVTLADIIERLVGEVPDEYGREQPSPELQHGGVMLMSGLTPLIDLSDILGVDIQPTETVTTLGGFMFAQLGREPKTGDVVPIGAYTLSVEELDGLRIAQVKAELRSTDATS